MTEWIEQDKKDENLLYVHLKDPSLLDLSIFDRMSNDDFCLPCMLTNEKSASIVYATEGYIPLHDFLSQYVFENEEGYIFLHQLFEQAIASNRNKPVLFDPDYVFVSGFGDRFAFVVVPIQISNWKFQKDMSEKWVEYIAKTMQTTTAFEIPGFLLKFLKSAEFSLPNLVLGLDNIKELLERLGNPQDQLRVVHIAGTNGKGSTLAFLAGIFRESGYRAGRYVSPASFSYEERFRINEENISKKDLCFYMEKIKKISDEMVRDGMSHPTMFEIETALSFLYFLDKKVDFVILETGMGGRLDATNVVKKPIAVIIASIGMDHMQFLGDTIEKIAAEKAGIIKEGCPVI